MYSDMATKGTVLKIERFAIHDGPGIRTLIFMKGCPLRCGWCSTPESHKLSPEMEYFADRCLRCARCVEVCRSGAISVLGNGEIFTDRGLCINCDYYCAEVCPSVARKIAGEEMTVEEVLAEVEKDTVFHANSGGGVTLGGGEPTMQPEFALGILKACKDRGIHTAIETCAYVKWSIFNELLKYLDLVYIDIKHMSPAEHKNLTGKSNGLILENIKRVAMNYPDKPLIIRIPVIPGYNDSDKNIINTVQFLRQLDGDHKIELLPYHKLGVSHYRMLSRDYPMPDLESPPEERMRALEELVESYGIPAQIGG
jgi:pyruvate formate lyase activating enzyme